MQDPWSALQRRLPSKGLLLYPGKRAPSVKSRAVKHGADPMSLTPLEARVAVAKKVRESSPQTGVQTEKVTSLALLGMHACLICSRRTSCQAHLLVPSWQITYIKLVILARSRAFLRRNKRKRRRFLESNWWSSEFLEI